MSLLMCIRMPGCSEVIPPRWDETFKEANHPTKHSTRHVTSSRPHSGPRSGHRRNPSSSSNQQRRSVVEDESSSVQRRKRRRRDRVSDTSADVVSISSDSEPEGAAPEPQRPTSSNPAQVPGIIDLTHTPSTPPPEHAELAPFARTVVNKRPRSARRPPWLRVAFARVYSRFPNLRIETRLRPHTKESEAGEPINWTIHCNECPDNKVIQAGPGLTLLDLIQHLNEMHPDLRSM